MLLATMGRKYDQYLDFAQQDAHEFLRILLDAMRMEEFDVGSFSLTSRSLDIFNTDLFQRLSKSDNPSSS
jgi:uncharacterized UBP type Zn finger protein